MTLYFIACEKSKKEKITFPVERATFRTDDCNKSQDKSHKNKI